MIISAILFLVGYSLFLIWLWVGFKRSWRNTPNSLAFQGLVSFIIPIRNEEENLYSLFQSLKGLSRKSGSFEIILVDDHSEDNSLHIIKTKAESFSGSIQILSLKGGTGKKAALNAGILQAKGEVILTSDADCTMNPQWIDSITAPFVNPDIVMVSGPVGLWRGKSWFSRWQTLEFSSLIFTGSGTLNHGLPTMVNGANLAFRKAVFHEIGGYKAHMHIPSGDDEFLFQAIFKKYPAGVVFNASPTALVKATPARDWKQFFQQRKRWAGKWKQHKKAHIAMLAIGVFTFHLFTIGFLIFTLAGGVHLGWLLGFILIKILMEWTTLFAFHKRLRKSWDAVGFITLQIFYPLYVVIFGLASNFGQFKWKGRTYRV